MQASRAGLHEFSLEAELDYEFRKGGAKMPAYGSIVAAGRNSCILHYQQNDALLKDGDLVLIDAGCEIDCYASDITRTWPVNGKFSPRAKGDLRDCAGLPGSRLCRDRAEQTLEPGPRGDRAGHHRWAGEVGAAAR